MKLREFQAYLREQQIDCAFFAHPDPHITYFTHTRPTGGYLLITSRQAYFFASALDKVTPPADITIQKLQKSWHTRVHPKILGINKEALTVQQQERLRKIFPGARMRDIAPALHQLRSLKTPAEVQKISAACEITSQALHALVRELPRRKLQTEQEVAFFLDQNMREQGAEPAFPTIVAMGKNAAIPHHQPSTQKLRRGFLVLDFGACYRHYCADMTRVLFLGKPTSQEKEFYALLLNAQTEALIAVRAGLSFTELDMIARKRLGKYSPYFIHSLGHGIGIEVHEAPTFSDKKLKIAPGQVFTIEPGIYFPGKFGLRIEDTLCFDGKVKILTTFTKELLSIPV